MWSSTTRAWAATRSALPRGSFAKQSFRNDLVANLDAHNLGAMPILYRLA